MRLYKPKDIPKQHRNSPDSPPRATSASPDGRLPHRLKRAAEAVSRQLASHKAMISQFNNSKPPRQPVIDHPPPLKRSNAVKGSVKPPVVPRKADVPKPLSPVTGSKKRAPLSSTSPKSRTPPAPPGLGTKNATPQRAKNILTTLVAPIKPQSLSTQTPSPPVQKTNTKVAPIKPQSLSTQTPSPVQKTNTKVAPTKPQSLSTQAPSPVQKTNTKPSASPAERSATPANPASVPLASIPEQDEVDELLLPASCFRPLTEESDEEEDWGDDDVEPTSDFDTQITQIFSHGLGPQSKDDVARHAEIAPPLATPGATLAQTMEPMSALVENWRQPVINVASNSDGFETIPLHLTVSAVNHTPSVSPIVSSNLVLQQSLSSRQPPSISSVSPIVSSNLILQQSLSSCQPPPSLPISSVSPIVSSNLVLQQSPSSRQPSSISLIPSVSPIVSSNLALQQSLSSQPPSISLTPSVSPIVSSNLVLQHSLSSRQPSSISLIPSVSPIVSSNLVLQQSLSSRQPPPSPPISSVSPIVSFNLVIQQSLSSRQPPQSPSISSVSPIVSSNLILQQSLSSRQPPSSPPISSVSPIVSSNLVLQEPLSSCQPPSSTDYEFVSYIGNGAFGSVLLGIHKQNRRSCAIKIMTKATVEEQDTLHAVLAEQRVMRHASGHPYILGLLASFHDSDNFYLVSEYCVSSLFEAQLFEADKKLASAELACAIDHLHGLGIIHRDIKLENVMIKTDGHIVLGDFGLACSLEASPESHLNDSLSTDGGDFFVPVSTDICGTLPYMAPEVLCGMEYSYNVDWFSYGVFLHVFHLNEFPWLGSHENPTSYLKALMSAISLGTIFQNKLFGDLLKKLLSPNQDARGGFSIVKRATFFADIDWEDVMNVASSAPYPLSKPASEVCDALGDKHPPFTGYVAQSTMDPDQFPNFTWVNPSMIVGESIPDGSGGHPEGCTTDVLSDSVSSLDEGEDPIYIFPPCWIAAFEDSAIYLRERKAERTQTTPQDDEALVRTTIRSLDAGEEPVFDLPSGWKDAFSPSPSPEVIPLSSPRPDVAEKSSVLPRLKSLWKRAASKFAPRHV